MKYLKTYEYVNLKGGPKIGDYVLLKDIPYGDKLFDKFLINNICQVIGFEDGWSTGLVNYKKSKKKHEMFYLVRFDYIPKKVIKTAYQFLGRTINSVYDQNVLGITNDNIKDYSSNREDLELILAANKYNM